eukprot:5416164-Pyramimonas_sp.AAC.1
MARTAKADVSAGWVKVLDDAVNITSSVFHIKNLARHLALTQKVSRGPANHAMPCCPWSICRVDDATHATVTWLRTATHTTR